MDIDTALRTFRTPDLANYPELAGYTRKHRSVRRGHLPRTDRVGEEIAQEELFTLTARKR